MAVTADSGGLPNTMYHKIHDVLDVCSTRRDARLSDLVEAILARRFDSFAYWAPRTEPGDRRRQCSPSTVRRAIRLTQALSLLSIDGQGKTCRLTPDGENALRPGRFEPTIADRVQRRLQSLGYGYTLMSRVIESICLPDLPDAQTLYDRRPEGAEGLGESEFRRLLRLLADCHRFRVRNARLFFPAD